jgi:hypothetical protein
LGDAETAMEDKVLARLAELPKVVKVQASEIVTEDAAVALPPRNKLLADIENAVKTAMVGGSGKLTV